MNPAVCEGQPIEQIAVAVASGFELLHVRRELRDVVRVDLDQLRQLLGIVLMMRQRMMGLVDVDGRIGPVAQLASHHERDHAG
jgi:hypothetical protein